MAINATTVWRLRTGGNAANSAGFDSTISGGTDRSQQDSPHVTFDGATITAITGGTSDTITITGYTVITGDAGNVVNISGGTNFTVGYYLIIAVNTGANTWQLDRNCTSGVGAAMVGRMGGAARQLVDVATSVVAGNTIYVRATAGNATSYPTSSLDYTISAYFTPTNGSEAAGFVKWIGENGMPTIGAPGLAIYNCQYSWLEGLYFVATGAANPSNGMLNPALGSVIYNCIVNQNSQAGLIGINAPGATKIISCEVYGGSTSPSASSGAHGIMLTLYGSGVIGCRIRYCRDGGITSNGAASGCLIQSNFIYGCAGNGIESSITGTVDHQIIGNTIDGNSGHGITITGTNGAIANIIRNNNITNHTQSGKSGINVATSDSDKRKPVWGWNNVWNNTANYTNVTADSTDLSVDPDYVDAANGDFTPQEVTLKGAAFPENL